MGGKSQEDDPKKKRKGIAVHSLEEKIVKTREILQAMRSVLVAFSGGVDSTFLLRLAREELGDGVVALLASSPTYPEGEIRQARKMAENLRVRAVEVLSQELTNSDFLRNTPQRCYHCKRELFRLCWQKARDLGLRSVVDGSNSDDADDYRPGMRAARELAVRSPLMEAGLTKAEIREASHQLGLPTWDKPSLACLSSRIPYGTPITLERLRQVERAEEFLRRFGFRDLRVRHHGELARIEVGLREMGPFQDENLRQSVVQFLKEIGFTFVTLDLQGYRTGALNEALKNCPKDQRRD